MGLMDRFDAVRSVMLTRSTQTNESGRGAVLLPILTSLPQPWRFWRLGRPLAWCLFLDRYGYDYSSRSLRPTGASDPVPYSPARPAKGSPFRTRCRRSFSVPVLISIR
ncbi:DUF2332 family protein [Tianweitania sediminis]|uniref:DUF2332 family protein n=2 Tax=Tianweitania sediminis TaxID=1502156 RepID=A0A8J7R0W5_9HYPH|nr:DUF2332 family protein [Tianweitania sediminis]